MQEGCHYFTYSSGLATCSLYHYRYLERCELVGGTAQPAIDDCHQEVEDTCGSYVREDCAYSRVVFSKASVTDAHSCQQLLAILGRNPPVQLVQHGSGYRHNMLSTNCRYATKLFPVLCKKDDRDEIFRLVKTNGFAQSCRSGSTLIRIPFPCWIWILIRIRIQDGKIEEEKTQEKSMALVIKCNFIKI